MMTFIHYKSSSFNLKRALLLLIPKTCTHRKTVPAPGPGCVSSEEESATTRTDRSNVTPLSCKSSRLTYQSHDLKEMIENSNGT